jgi:hypothetical protein
MKEMELSGEHVATERLRAVLKSQYHATLAMLRETIERCPAEVWASRKHRNAFWQVAYHTLFFTHLYLQPNEAAFRHWPGQQSDVQHPDGIAGPAAAESSLPLIPEPYSKEEVLEYWAFCEAMVDGAVDALDIDSPESGFSWYQVSKLEHQIINIRHIAHHMAQLADRLRAAADIGIRWVDAGPAKG